MSYKTEAIECLKKSLTNVICSNTIHRLEDLIERVSSFGKTTHRLSLEDGTVIKSVDDIIANINEDEVLFTTTEITKNYTNQGISFSLTPLNIFVDISGTRIEDSGLVGENGGWGRFNISFTLTYLNDNDKELPLKLIYFSLRGCNDGIESK